MMKRKLYIGILFMVLIFVLAGCKKGEKNQDLKRLPLF